jgi:NADH dehydrogenase [ubiquinone] 1 alpha subcomplex assembly factor 1
MELLKIFYREPIISMNSVRQSGCLLRRFALKISSPSRPVHVGSKLNSIYEKDEKGGYRKNLDDVPSRTELIRDGFKELKGEILLWKEEMREKFACDPLFIVRKGTILMNHDHNV